MWLDYYRILPEIPIEKFFIKESKIKKLDPSIAPHLTIEEVSSEEVSSEEEQMFSDQEFDEKRMYYSHTNNIKLPNFIPKIDISLFKDQNSLTKSANNCINQISKTSSELITKRSDLLNIESHFINQTVSSLSNIIFNYNYIMNQDILREIRISRKINTKFKLFIERNYPRSEISYFFIAIDGNDVSIELLRSKILEIGELRDDASDYYFNNKEYILNDIELLNETLFPNSRIPIVNVVTGILDINKITNITKENIHEHLHGGGISELVLT